MPISPTRGQSTPGQSDAGRPTRALASAILTDVQFWIPAVVLLLGVVLLVLLH